MKTPLLCLLLALSLTACDLSETTLPTEPIPDPEPSAVQVTAAGTCRPLTAGIQCTDESLCTQDGAAVACASVFWDVVNAATGVGQDSKAASPNERVQFDGIAPGDYAITQTTTASDGNKDDQVHNVTIASGGGS